MMMFWYGHDLPWWGYAGMAVGIVVVWAFVVVGIVALARYVVSERRSAAPPAQVLAARFAAGEITEAEYQERLAVLRRAGQ